MDHDVESIVS